MNKFHLVILLFFIAKTIALGQSEQENKSDVALDSIEWLSLSDEIFDIKYPSNWEADDSGQMGTSFILFSPQSDASDKFKENVNLLIQDLTGYDLNLDQYVELSESQIETMATEGEIILSERINTGDDEFHKVVYTATQGIFELKFLQYYIVIENEAYVLTLTCEEDVYAEYQETGEKILNSFVLKMYK